jgi:hypothetical protein
VPSRSTWSRSLKPKCCLTILGSSCAISMYVVLFFEAQVLPDDFSASSCAISMYVVSFLEAQALPHDFPLFVCHRYVRGLVPSSTSAASRFLPLRVPSGSTWSSSLEHKHYLTISASSCAIRKYVSRSLKHKCRLILSASSCAIREYVVSFFEAQVLPDDFCLFVCHQ